MRQFKAVLSLVVFISSFMLVSTASACSWSWDWSNGCYEDNNRMIQDGNGSMNGSDYSSQPTIVYLPPKASQYGAIAQNFNTGDFGHSFSQSSSHAAKKQALNNCGGDCKIISTYSNQCVAWAWGPTSSGKGFGPIKYNLSLDQAKSEALETCSAVASNCQIFVAECSLP